MMRAAATRVALPLVLLAGCAAPPSPPVTPERTPAPTPVPQVTGKQPELKKETIAYLAKRNLVPITGRALTARASCSFHDDDGYRGQLDLAVANAQVERLDARVDVPNHGSCQFRLADFRQTDALPIVVLAARQGPCKVSLWEQGNQVTVAFRDCRAECTGDAVNYLWPILVDSRKGSCS